MGLLNMQSASGDASGGAPSGMGLLGSFYGGQAAQAASADPKQMAMMLAQSPTPDTVQKLIAQIKGSNAPDGEKWIQVLSHFANSPNELKQIAQEVMKNA